MTQPDEPDDRPMPILRAVLLERVACVKLVLKYASDNNSMRAVELARQMLDRPVEE